MADLAHVCTMTVYLHSITFTHAEIPQRSVIAPCLFNHYVWDYTRSFPLISVYADDFTASSSDYKASSTIHVNYAGLWCSWVGRKQITAHRAHKITLHPLHLRHPSISHRSWRYPSGWPILDAETPQGPVSPLRHPPHLTTPRSNAPFGSVSWRN